eukprot:CAMPEP_0179484388 /NCGR_PEP_ID=MMETSP0799-20121207/61274_1 /TAXON_ID=46947 /ORGANISM="Geminigera cryophila, Strain CCMP2564" /LENGTH=115 /DNA_ID=CAMNT_0021298261 /DNA_START=99 /DNA_END=442 /DNA_ORIENTATION=+
MPTVQLPAKLLETLIIADSPASLLQASRVIDELLTAAEQRGWIVVGLDTEWKPVFEKGTTSSTSILQVAWVEQCVFFDLIWLDRADIEIRAAGWTLINKLLSSPCLLKLGVGFQG